jgi:hypothetical protein
MVTSDEEDGLDFPDAGLLGFDLELLFVLWLLLEGEVDVEEEDAFTVVGLVDPDEMA